MCISFKTGQKKPAIAEFVASAVAVREDLAGIELMHYTSIVTEYHYNRKQVMSLC